MKKLLFLVGLLAAAIVAGTPSNATTYATKYYKTITMNITVTPTPLAYVPRQSIGRDDPASFTAALHGDDLRFAIAFAPMQLGDIALAQNSQGSVPVTWSAKPDPSAAYLRVTSTDPDLNAGYGANTWSCAFSVFAYYTTAWEVSDYVYGSNASGGTAGLNGYPTYNYKTTSLLEWEAQGITTSYKAYANDGAPGEVTFTGAAGTNMTVCINLSLDIGTSVAPGTYQATLQYNLLTAL